MNYKNIIVIALLCLGYIGCSDCGSRGGVQSAQTDVATQPAPPPEGPPPAVAADDSDDGDTGDRIASNGAVSLGLVGDACTQESDCRNGLTCSDGRCARRPDSAVGVCGDGVINSTENCDDGQNNGRYNFCRSDCSAMGPRCGDGVIQTGEECDDGNIINVDSCLRTCRLSRCGDGYVFSGEEECDDANIVAGDGCNSACRNEIPPPPPSPPLPPPPAGVDTVTPVFRGLESATEIAPGQVKLTWPISSDAVTSSEDIEYLIYKSTSHIDNSSSYELAVRGQLGVVVTGLESMREYFFVVRARDRAGNVDNNTTELSVRIAGRLATATGTASTTLSTAAGSSGTSTSSLSATTSGSPLSTTATGSGGATGSLSSTTTGSTMSTTATDSVDREPPVFAGISSVEAISPTEMRLTWPSARDSVTRPEDVEYLVYRGNASITDFTTHWAVTTGGVASATYSVTINALEPGREYFFAVRARDRAGNVDDNTVQMSAVWILTQPMLIAPMDDGLMTNPRPTFSWNAVAGAVSYQIAVYNTRPSADDSPTVQRAETNITNHFFDRGLSEASHYWRVRAVSVGGSYGRWSIVRRIVVGRVSGDIDGDRYSDVAIGAPGEDHQKGNVYIFFGDVPMSTTPSVVLRGESDGDRFGHSVNVDDINNDGFADIIVGAPYASRNSGKVYIYFGGSRTDDIPDVIFDGRNEGDLFGASVASVGDMNDDGYIDIIIGAPYVDVDAIFGGDNRGKAYIYYGNHLSVGSRLSARNADITLTGEADEDQLGFSVNSAGDTNNDGYADAIIGVPLADDGGRDNVGKICFYLGGPIGGESCIIPPDAIGNDLVGKTVSGAGDIDGDGSSDYVFGATGSAYVSTSDGILTKLNGEPDSLFGFSVCHVGDLNGDRYPEIVVGAPLAKDAAGRTVGSISIFRGSFPMSTAPTMSDIGRYERGSLGFSVSPAGDINRDSIQELIVGAPYARDDRRGEAIIHYFSGTRMTSFPIFGAQRDGYFGYSVAGGR